MFFFLLNFCRRTIFPNEASNHEIIMLISKKEMLEMKIEMGEGRDYKSLLPSWKVLIATTVRLSVRVMSPLKKCTGFILFCEF